MLSEFLLIVCGFFLCRYTSFNRSAWEVAERFAYYVFLPALLFFSIVKSPIHLSTASAFVGSGFLIVVVGMVAAYLLQFLKGIDPYLHANGAQVAFRFNSYIAIALAEYVYPDQGVALIAILLAVCVPACNVCAVWFIAKNSGQSSLKLMIKNPLILSTIAGILVQGMGISIPAWLLDSIGRIGQAALPLGLLAVGASLKLSGFMVSPALTAGLLTIRHLLLPAVAVLLGTVLALNRSEQLLLVGFSALPTATSAYILTVRMGGDGTYVAGLITLSTLLGIVSIPLWLSLLELKLISGF